MQRAIIIPERCLNCSPCHIELACKSKAIIRESILDKPWIDFYNCIGCLKCMAVCQGAAVEYIVQPCNGKPKMGW